METTEITHGNFRGIEIGASKQAALEAIRRLEVVAVRVIPATSFNVTSDTANDLRRLTFEGLRVTNYQGLTLDLFFDGDVLTSINSSVPARNNEWFRVGQSKDATIERLIKHVQADTSLNVFPVAKAHNGDQWIEISPPNQDGLLFLMNKDAWTFELPRDPPGGAHVDTFFEAGKVARIVYRRPRVRL